VSSLLTLGAYHKDDFLESRSVTLKEFLKRGPFLYKTTGTKGTGMYPDEFTRVLKHDDTISTAKNHTTWSTRLNVKTLWDDREFLVDFLNLKESCGTPSRQLTTGTSTMTDQAQVEADPGTSTT